MWWPAALSSVMATLESTPPESSIATLRGADSSSHLRQQCMWAVYCVWTTHTHPLRISCVCVHVSCTAASEDATACMWAEALVLAPKRLIILASFVCAIASAVHGAHSG